MSQTHLREAKEVLRRAEAEAHITVPEHAPRSAWSNRQGNSCLPPFENPHQGSGRHGDMCFALQRSFPRLVPCLQEPAREQLRKELQKARTDQERDAAVEKAKADVRLPELPPRARTQLSSNPQPTL